MRSKWLISLTMHSQHRNCVVECNRIGGNGTPLRMRSFPHFFVRIENILDLGYRYRHSSATMTDGSTTIYKILTIDQWTSFQESGVFAGNPLDVDDGYVHMS
jgi:hypothetical protein